MKTYLVFEPAQGRRDADAAGRVVFLREKFRWLALFFAPLWLLWNRLWLAFFLWLAAEIVLSLAAYLLDIDPRLAAPVLWLPTLIVAFEGTELLRRKLLRRGFREAGVIVANDIDEAEERFFAEWPASGSRPTATARGAAPASVPPAANPVIGLFPEPRSRA